MNNYKKKKLRDLKKLKLLVLSGGYDDIIKG